MGKEVNQPDLSNLNILVIIYLIYSNGLKIKKKTCQVSKSNKAENRTVNLAY